MFKILKPNGNKITAVVNNDDRIKDVIDGVLTTLGGKDIFTPSENKEVALLCFKRLLMKSITDNVKLVENTPYIVTIVVDGSKLIFSCVKLQSDKTESGHSIALTLLD